MGHLGSSSSHYHLFNRSYIFVDISMHTGCSYVGQDHTERALPQLLTGSNRLFFLGRCDGCNSAHDPNVDRVRSSYQHQAEAHAHWYSLFWPGVSPCPKSKVRKLRDVCNSTVISGMVRLILLERYTASIPKDPFYTILYSISTIEVGLAFIVACAPSMKPLLRYVLPKVLGSTGYGRTTARSGHLGYELSETPRKGRAQSRTQIEASGNFDAVDLGDLPGDGKNGILMVKETEIRWHEVKEKSVKNATSTESLV